MSVMWCFIPIITEDWLYDFITAFKLNHRIYAAQSGDLVMSATSCLHERTKTKANLISSPPPLLRLFILV
jgi:hypothetical protein